MEAQVEYCPVKSAVTKALHSPYTWVLASFVLGVLLMSAVGKDNDIQKAIWFATGAAITAVATAYQAYQSNKRAADEREFSSLQNSLQREHEIKKSLQEHTANIRLSAYVDLIRACMEFTASGFNDKALTSYTQASTTVRIVGNESISDMCVSLFQEITKLRDLTEKNDTNDYKQVGELSAQLGLKIRELTYAMRDDLGKSNISLSTQPK